MAGGSRFIPLTLAVALAAACVDPESGAGDAAVDAGSIPDAPDATIDAGTTLDAPDVTTDVTIDAARDVTTDVTIDAARDVTTDVTTDTTIDASTAPDVVAADAGRDAAAVDAGPDADPPGFVAVQRQGACALWTRLPPALDYAPVAADDEGLWAVAPRVGVPGNININGAMMLRRDGHWRMASDPSSAASPVWLSSALLPTTGGLVWLNGNYGLFQRRAGRWESIDDARISGGMLTARWAWGAHAFGFITGAAASARLMHFDGARWEELPSLPRDPNTLRSGWGDRSALYVAENSGAWRFDGAAWTGIASPAPGALTQFGGPSTADVYAIGDHLYRVDAGALRRLTGVVDCGGGVEPTYRQLASAPGHALLVGSCASGRRAWRLTAGAWTPLGEVPGDGTVTMHADGRAFLTGAGGAIWSLEASGWVDLEEQPAPPAGAILGSSIDDLLIAGDGLWRYRSDRWTAVPEAAGMHIDSAWRAPDGTLFFTRDSREFWRFADGRLTHDLPDVTEGRVLTGRSSREVYRYVRDASAVPQLSRWDGAAWTPMGSPCFRLDTLRLVPSGSNRLVANCLRDSQTVRESEGGAPWNNVLSRDSASQVVLRYFGPAASPTAYMFGLTSGIPGSDQQRSEAGWLPVALSGWVASGPGPDLAHTVDFTSAGYGRFGTSSGRVQAWFTTPVRDSDQVWSDLRTVLGTTAVQSHSIPPNPKAGALFRCELAR